MNDLVEPLAHWASGSSGTEAAVELLIETGYWLLRAEFVAQAVTRSGDGAQINWDVASELAESLVCSRGERFVLRLACSLADASKTVAMAEIGSIDGRNLARVQEALRTAKFGWS
ncbi:MAG: hypothetical protein ACN4GZ_14005 [Acidimicrobiales bacterium]